MAAHNWELVRDLFLARYQGDQASVQRLEAAIQDFQRCCEHVPNPERPERCYKCGDGLRPGLAKVQSVTTPQAARRTG